MHDKIVLEVGGLHKFIFDNLGWQTGGSILKKKNQI
jgi:hypothetical protein